jgi:hypothetical protein
MNPVVWRREWDSNPLAMNGDSNSLKSQAAQTGLNFLCPFRIRDHLHRERRNLAKGGTKINRKNLVIIRKQQKRKYLIGKLSFEKDVLNILPKPLHL